MPDHTATNIAIGLRIRRLRLWSGKKQKEVAKKAGITFQQLSKYEYGKDRLSAAAAEHIAEALQVPVWAFFDPRALCLPELPPQLKVLQLVANTPRADEEERRIVHEARQR